MACVLTMCRLCFARDALMYSLVNTKLQDLYENLTAAPFQVEDGRPLHVCYVCRARLQSCYRLQSDCLRSEELFTRMLATDQMKPTVMASASTFKTNHPIVHLSCVPVTLMASRHNEMTPKENMVTGSHHQTCPHGCLSETDHLRTAAPSQDAPAEPPDNIIKIEDEDEVVEDLTRTRAECVELTPRDDTPEHSIPATERVIRTDEIQNNLKAAPRIKPVGVQNIPLRSVKVVMSRIDLSGLSANAPAEPPDNIIKIEDEDEVVEDLTRTRAECVELTPRDDTPEHSIPATERVIRTDEIQNNLKAAPRIKPVGVQNIPLRSVKVVMSRIDLSGLSANAPAEPPDNIIKIEDEDEVVEDLTRTRAECVELTPRDDTPEHSIPATERVIRTDEIQNNLKAAPRIKPVGVQNIPLRSVKVVMSRIDLSGLSASTPASYVTKLPQNGKIKNTESEKLKTDAPLARALRHRDQRVIKKKPVNRGRARSTRQPYKCDICEKQFKTKLYLKYHTHSHSDDKLYRCDTCLQRFAKKSALNKHICLHIKKKLYKCFACEKRFTKKTHLRTHMRVHAEKKLSCNICGQYFIESSAFNKHIYLHITEKPYKCDMCDKRFTYKNNLIQHVRLHSGDNWYTCDTCDKSFTQKVYLSKHIRTHGDNKPYKCNLCDKCFNHKQSLVQHSRVHTSDTIYKCDKCDKSFSCEKYLLKHSRIHTGEKPHKCAICDRRFNQKQTLTHHMRIHTGEKPFKCDTCEKLFNQKQNLLKHKLIHTGERPFKCDVCEKGFTQKQNLLDHLHKHAGHKLYRCDNCEKCFNQKGNLLLHVRTHVGQKPFKCSLCDKCFTQKGNLLQHERTHTGEKPFKCDICDKRFNQKGNLLQHTRRHNNG